MPRAASAPRSTYVYRPNGRGGPDPESSRDITVDLEEERQEQPSFEMDGGEVAESKEQVVPEGSLEDGDFHENLAEHLPEAYLTELGQELVELVLQDIEDRQPWRDRFERGLEMMGLIEADIDDGPFPGASNVVHPLLITARTEFWARAMAELFPPEGFVKTELTGDNSEVQQQRGDRVAEYMNWQMKEQDVGFIDEMSSLTWDTPFYGSTFCKTFRDPKSDTNTSIYISADDLIVPAEGKNLRTTPRFTHRMKLFPEEVQRLMLAGYYRDIELEVPSHEEEDQTENLKKDTQDLSTTDDGDESTTRHELFEVCVDRTIPGDEHVDDDGKETKLNRSYYITVDRHTEKVLSIYRGWKEEDKQCQRKVAIEHFRFCPGQGFYGSGLFHLIGGLQIAATGTLRVLLDSAASASLSGGFVSRHANLKGKRLVLTPGHWDTVDASAEDLQNAFYSPPVKEPSPALFQLLSFLTEQGQNFTATTELMTGGTDPKNAPVGTTNAMIEQGGKVMTTIHRLMHEALHRVFKTRYELDQEFAPADGYPYDLAGQQRTVYADDFAPGVGITPVSDPNIFSSSQRIQLYQAAIQTATTTGQGDLKKLVYRLYVALKIPDVDEILPMEAPPQAYDPVGEIQAVLLGKPVKVVPQQLHVMHLQVLHAFMSNPQYGSNPEVQKQAGPALMAIMAQHLAYAWATSARGLGVPAGFMDPATGQYQAQGTPEQIAAMCAQIAPQLMQSAGLPPPPQQSGEDGAGKLQIMQQELAMKQQAHDQDMQQKVQMHGLDIQQKQSKLEADKQMNQQKVEIAGAKAEGDMKVAEIKAQAQQQQAHLDAHVKQQQAEQQMATNAAQAQHQQTMDQHKLSIAQQTGDMKLQHLKAQGDQKMQQGAMQHEQTMQQSHAQNAQALEAQSIQQQHEAGGGIAMEPQRQTHAIRRHGPPTGSGGVHGGV